MQGRKTWSSPAPRPDCARQWPRGRTPTSPRGCAAPIWRTWHRSSKARTRAPGAPTARARAPPPLTGPGDTRARGLADHDIRGDVLRDLDNDTLKDMGIVSAGVRLRFLRALDALRARP